jgi:hypothetical protein
MDSDYFCKRQFSIGALQATCIEFILNIRVVGALHLECPNAELSLAKTIRVHTIAVHDRVDSSRLWFYDSGSSAADYLFLTF